MIPLLTAYGTNGSLAAAGQPLQWSPLFLYGALSIIGGTGNTLPLTVMGLRSKSKRISAVSKASFVPGLMNINEPAIFGYPIMYNPVLFIPFLINPLIVGLLLLIAYQTGLIVYPQAFIMTSLPIIFSTFMQTFSWRNCLFAACMFPVVYLIYLPFFKVYEKQCIEQEAAEEAAEAAEK